LTIAEGVAGSDQVIATAGAFLTEGEVVKPMLIPGKS